jgi:uncharacterized protein
MVNEAGASVWSVTEQAGREFPDATPAAIAAVSIARRYQNALLELVKIPPRSLGLGMYQHDFAPTVLDRHLHATTVDCVAAVVVDLNAGSLEILRKVPGITAMLAEHLVAARPWTSRQDLLHVSGVGPQAYQHCAAFLRLHHGRSQHPLDATLVHPANPSGAALALFSIESHSMTHSRPFRGLRRAMPRLSGWGWLPITQPVLTQELVHL